MSPPGRSVGHEEDHFVDLGDTGVRSTKVLH